MMKYWKLVIPFLVLPSIVCPYVEAPPISVGNPQSAQSKSPSIDLSHLQPMAEHSYTYDDILDLLDELEEGDLEQYYTIEELDQISKFVAHLAINGLLPGDFNEARALQTDIQDLLSDSEFQYAYSSGENDYIYLMDSGEVILCKSWISKKWKKAKKFVKKHKKAIIIGVAVVVGVALVVGSVAALSTAAAVGAGAAASDDSDKTPNSKPDYPAQPQPEKINLKTVIDENVNSFKEMIVEDDLLQVSSSPEQPDPSIADKARYLGSYFAHESLEAISELVGVIPSLCEDIKEIGSQFVPNSFLRPNEHVCSPKENYKVLVGAGHQKIDQIFATDQARHYPHEPIEGQKNFVYGILPPPGLLSGSRALSGNSGRIAITQATDVCGWEVGQAITNRTRWGSVPTWNTVRRRFWKTEAYLHPEQYEAKQIDRMREGLAPQRFNMDTGKLESMELHHDPAQRDGGLFDFIKVWPDEHVKLDPKRYLGE